MTLRFDADRFRRIDSLFDAALDLSPHERVALLDRECAGDVALRTEVEALLASADTAESALGEHVAEFAAVLIGDMADEIEEATLEPGLLLGPWRIVREIGRGGMGAVYLALRADGAYDLQVAVKVVKRGMDTGAVLRRFRDERRILAALDHPNIARLIDAGAAPDGRPYLVMEYVLGETIDRWCDARGLDVPARVTLFRAVCEAVHQAHRRLIVHRDVKPSNVLITKDGVPKLLDFGIAKLLEHDGAGTVTQVRALTPAYAAPEQFSDAPITTAADVYSLGVLLHQLLTGERPARAAATVAIRGDLGVIVQRAIVHDPARRYGSALQLAEDLDRWQHGRPVLARPDSLAYRASRFVQRNRIAVTAAALALVTLIGFSIAMAAAQGRTADALARAENERDTAEEVAGLLEGLFSAGDPMVARRERLDTFRVAALLDRSTTRVRRELADRPVVQARLLRSLGDAYRGLGLFDAADSLLHDAVATQRTLPDSSALADALNSLGLLELQRGRSPAAQPWLTEAVTIGRRHRDSDDGRLVRMISNLAAAHQNQNDDSSAIALYAEAEQLIMNAPEPDLGALALVLNGRGNIAQRAADFETAATFAQRIVDIDRERLGPEHPRVAIDLANAAFMELRLGRLERADSMQTAATELLHRTVGESHPMYITALASLANTRAMRGLRNEARPMFEDAIAATRRVMGPTPELSITLSQYGDMLAADSAFAPAVEAVREAIDIARRAFGPAHPAVGQTTAQLARIECARGNTDTGIALHREAVSVLSAALPPTHARVVGARRQLAECLADAGR